MARGLAGHGRPDRKLVWVGGRRAVGVQLAGGEATAAAVPGAELLVVPGMGHDLPRVKWPIFVERITAMARGAVPV